ncbi:MAG: NUDIX domain-containing protein [Firmicutes bacterium]|nr:NUDIX domain-containing protein [Bacillota bacterium]
MAQDNIRIGVPTLVVKGDKILLGESNKPGMQKGQYVIPGGGVDFGERLAETSEREIFEETNLKIKNTKFFKAYELIKPEKQFHRIFALHVAEWQSGEIKPSDDLASAGFFTRQEVAKLYADGKIEKDGPPAWMLKDTGWL